MTAWLSAYSCFVATASASEADELCRGTESASKADLEKNGTLAQRKTHCDAIRGYEKSIDENKVMVKMYAVMGGICTAECVASFFAAGNPPPPLNRVVRAACPAMSIGLSVYEAARAKDLASSLMGIGGSLASTAAAVPGILKPEENADLGACLTAAMSALQVFIRDQSISSNRSSIAAEIKALKELKGEGSAFSGSLSGGVGDAGSAAPITSNLGDGKSGEDTPEDSRASACGEAANGGGFGAHISCASAMDSSFGSAMNRSRFPQDAENALGMSPDDFVKKDLGPKPMLVAAMGGALPSSSVGDLAAAIEKAAEGEHVEGASYSGGGGGGGSGGSDDPNIAGMLEGILGSLGPGMPGKDGEKDPNAGLKAVIFANQKRKGDQVAEDRGLSIFDRITYRYYFVGHRMLGLTTTGGGKK